MAQFALRADAPTAVNIVSVGETAEQAEAVYKSVYGDDSGRNVIYLTKQAVFADTTLNLGGANQATDLLIDRLRRQGRRDQEHDHCYQHSHCYAHRPQRHGLRHRR